MTAPRRGSVQGARRGQVLSRAQPPRMEKGWEKRGSKGGKKQTEAWPRAGAKAGRGSGKRLRAVSRAPPITDKARGFLSRTAPGVRPSDVCPRGLFSAQTRRPPAFPRGTYPGGSLGLLVFFAPPGRRRGADGQVAEGSAERSLLLSDGSETRAQPLSHSGKYSGRPGYREPLRRK